METNLTPVALIKAHKTLEVGQVVSFHQGDLTIAIDERFGPIPDLTVVELTEKGAFKLGSFKCVDCDEIVTVHPGDVHQKRRCSTHQRMHLKKSAPKLSDEEKKARRIARLQKALTKAQGASNEATDETEADAAVAVQ